MTEDDMMWQGTTDIEDRKTLDRLFDRLTKFSFTVAAGSDLATIFAIGPYGPQAGQQRTDESRGDFLFRVVTKLNTPATESADYLGHR